MHGARKQKAATRAAHSCSCIPRVEATGLRPLPEPQANGSRNTMLASRSGPVETIASGQPASSSNARR